VQVRPVAGDTDDDSATVLVNPLSGAIVIVDVPAVPATTVTVVGLAAIVKSGRAVTIKVTVTVFVVNPVLAPLTVTV
jgi:hypothetical protein